MDTLALPPVSAWQVQSLRTTVFTEPGTAFDPSKWWPNLVGKEPENINTQPRQNLHQESGELDDNRVLTLQVLGARVDWFLAPIDKESVSFELIGALPDVLSPYVEMMRRWLPSCPPSLRLALGGVLIQPQPSRDQGYQQLGLYIPAVKLDMDSSDFSYQINRPRLSRTSIPNFQINRLTKWSVALHRRFNVLAGREAVSVADIASQSACRLEFDINTSQEFKGLLPHERMGDLLSELKDLAVEIAQRGDVK